MGGKPLPAVFVALVLTSGMRGAVLADATLLERLTFSIVDAVARVTAEKVGVAVVADTVVVCTNAVVHAVRRAKAAHTAAAIHAGHAADPGSASHSGLTGHAPGASVAGRPPGASVAGCPPCARRAARTGHATHSAGALIRAARRRPKGQQSHNNQESKRVAHDFLPLLEMKAEVYPSR